MITLSCYHDNMLSYFFSWKLHTLICGKIRFDSSTNIDSVLCHIARSWFILLYYAKHKILFTAMGQVRSPMADFFIDCYFKGFCKGRKNFLPTLGYAAQQGVNSALCCKAESRNSTLCCIAGSHDSALCSIAWSQHIFANFSANSQPYAKIF
jgi:hypothetical protein